jgi:sigma-E factor negative regulatory protein RseA
VDGEADDLERERVLRSVHTNPELRAAWERYHLISTAVRRELNMMVNPSLAEKIHAQLQNVTPDQTGLRFGRQQILRYTAGLAIAASVAAVAILNLSPVTTLSPATVAKAPAARTTAVAESRLTPPEQQRALNPYLVHHAEFSTTASMNGMSTYARVVGRDNVVADPNGTE